MANNRKTDLMKKLRKQLAEEREAEIGGRGCSGLRGGCGLIRCPNCGYEVPRTSGLQRLISSITSRKSADSLEDD